MDSKIILGLFFYIILCVYPSFAIDYISGIPENCNNNSSISDMSKLPFDVGPTWVLKCDDVCSFNSEGVVVSRQSVWYPRYTCAGYNHQTLTILDCVEDIKAANCKNIKLMKNDVRNHDCSKNEGGKWRCMGIDRTVSCTYKKNGTSRINYKNKIKDSECVKLSDSD